MIFDFNNLRLTHRIAILSVGVALFAVAIMGAMGDWMLRRLATDLAHVRTPTNVAEVERLVGGPVAASRVMTEDGREAILLVRMSDQPSPIPAVLKVSGAPQRIAVAAQGQEESTVGAMRTKLFLTCIAVLALGALLGFVAARIFTQPLTRVVSDLERLAKGDTTVKLTETSRQDEIGDISRAAVAFRSAMTELQSLKSRSNGRYSLPSGNGFVSAMREQWETAKRLLSGEWATIANGFRSQGSGSITNSSLWQSWHGWGVRSA